MPVARLFSDLRNIDRELKNPDRHRKKKMQRMYHCECNNVNRRTSGESQRSRCVSYFPFNAANKIFEGTRGLEIEPAFRGRSAVTPWGVYVALNRVGITGRGTITRIHARE